MKKLLVLIVAICSSFSNADVLKESGSCSMQFNPGNKKCVYSVTHGDSENCFSGNTKHQMNGHIDVKDAESQARFHYYALIDSGVCNVDTHDFPMVVGSCQINHTDQKGCTFSLVVGENEPICFVDSTDAIQVLYLLNEGLNCKEQK